MLSSAQEVQQIKARVLHTINHGLEFDLSTEQCKQFLKRHVNSNAVMVILLIDINGSTHMSITLPPSKFAAILQVFSQETRLAIIGHGGYVLKFVGDSVIGLFPAEFDKKRACINALNCAQGILSIISECINPVLNDNHLPVIRVRVGLDCGPSLVILYGKSIDTAPIDVVGPSISIASKIASIAQLNQVLVGESLYDIFASDNSFNHRFVNVKLPDDKWNYVKPTSGSIYELYSYE
jgi:class 3 adenylate cyclase